MGQTRNECRILDRKLEGKRPRGTPRREWEGNIKMNLTKQGGESVVEMHVAQDRDQWQALENTVMNIWVPWGSPRLAELLKNRAPWN
jgi:hypothetical protein